MARRRTKVSVMEGRKFAVASRRKFTGGEIVKPKGMKGRGKKWIVRVEGHESDFETPSNKHSYYLCTRGAWSEFFRSDKLREVSA